MKRTILSLALTLITLSSFSQAANDTSKIKKPKTVYALPDVGSPLSVTLTIGEWQAIQTSIGNSDMLSTKMAAGINSKINNAYNKTYPQPENKKP